MGKTGHLDNGSKFFLLFWKNWKTQWNHKWALVFQIIIPVVSLQLAVLILHQTVEPIARKEKHFPSLDLTKLTLKTRSDSDTLSGINMDRPLPVLLYSPNTSSIIDMIAKNAAESLLLSYKGYANAEQLTEALLSGNFLAGVQFNDVQDYPVKFSFNLRFPSELRTSKSRDTWMTTRLFPPAIYLGPRNAHEADGGHPVGYLREGFLTIQHALSMTYLKLASEQKSSLPEVQFQRYPYPTWVRGHFVHMSGKLLTTIILLSFMSPCVCITKYITSEKENQLKDITKIMGLPNWIHWAAWFLQAFMLLIVSVLIIIAILKFEWIENGCMLNKCSVTVLFSFLSVYVVNSICLCFMIATFFNKAGTAAAVFGLLWLLSYIPYDILIRTNDQRSLAHYLLWCLVSNTAMGLGFSMIIDYEKTGEGLQWSNILTPVSLDESLTLGYILFMMLASSLLYLLICLYVEQVFPGKFGVPRKWLFPLYALLSCGKKEIEVEKIIRIEKMIGNEAIHKKKGQRSNIFEAEPEGKIVGVKVQNLEKIFGHKKAVRNLTINLYQDEITVLLGHNGSGKTTLISMLTGMFPPTSGRAFVNGCEIVANKEGARMFVGICPHHNVLFDDLCVASNLEFFSRLKGLKGKAIQEEVKKYLLMTELKNDPNVASSQLSVGMKRLLAICCALCGGSKVVILDEPSSGMNPWERRQLWNLLQAEKPGRTLLLTTHSMDEADVLADRIAIMCNGDLKCYGTTFFLKKKYGYGYLLTCVKDENCNINNVSFLLGQYIPGLQPTKKKGTEFFYELSDEYTAVFEKMLEALEAHSETLKLKGFSISINSMSDIFSKVGAEKLKRVSTLKKGDIFSDEDLEFVTSGRFTKYKHLLWGFELCFNHWDAMFRKKYLYTLRKKLLFLVHITLPLCFIVATILFAIFEEFNDELPSMTMSLRQYPAIVTVLERDGELEDMPADAVEQKIAENYKKIANAGSTYTFQSTENSSFSEYILKLGKTIQSQVDTKYLVAATIKKDNIIAWLNNQPLHTAPLTLNLVHNAMAKALIKPEAEIIVTNAPLPYKPNEKLNRIVNGYTLGNDIAISICMSMCLVSALYTIFLIKERACRSKLMQFVSGVKVWTFWLTQYIWDMAIFIITALLVVLVLACFQLPYFSTFAELGRYFFVLMLFGFSMLPLMYLLSQFFSDPAIGSACICIINFFGGLLTFMISAIFHLSGNKETSKSLNGIFRVYPHFSLVTALNKLYINTATHDVCGNSMFSSLSSTQRCLIIPECCKLIPYFERKYPGICRELVYMGLTAIIFFLIIIIREYGWINTYVKIRWGPHKKLPIEDVVNMDEDVWIEKQKIFTMTKFEKVGENLLLDRVSKLYKNSLAVNQISLCVKRMECIGLLGINGAGKTTLLKMMTGDTGITHGSVHVRGYNIKRHKRKIYTLIGYCPQINPLLDELTGREHLKIFCLLRGIHKSRITNVSEGLAKSFGFMKHIDRKTEVYSDGNKRKLTTALAVIGKPVVIFLDEPTAGMDPAARHQLWDFLRHVRDLGMSIVLISHNMQECETLCNRLAIMVNGEIKCLGSSQHLKNKFSRNLVLKIKVRLNPDYLRQLTSDRLLHEEKLSLEMSEQKINRVKEFISHHYNQAILQEEHYGVLTFSIPLRYIKWSQIFGLMENNQEDLDIEDYTISQTTLEEIFMEFTKAQSNTFKD